MQILIVDDSRSSLAYLARITTDLGGCGVETFLRPSEALQRCSETQFDLVLVDHVMAEMDGVELTRHLRARQPYRLVPIVMVTPTASGRCGAAPSPAAPPISSTSPSTPSNCRRGCATCSPCGRPRPNWPTAPTGWPARSRQRPAI